MTKMIPLSLALAYLVSFQYLTGQQQNDTPKSNLQLVRVASLNTIDANKEFQKNVQLVQQQRALAAQISSKLDSVEAQDQRKNLEQQLENLQLKLNENNQLMFKTYGFTLNRNYVLTVEKSHIHMWVTEEEAKEIRLRTGKSDSSK